MSSFPDRPQYPQYPGSGPGGPGGPGDPGDPAYGAPGYGGPAPQQQRNGMGITALVLGALAVLFFWTIVGGILLGLLAVVFGVIGYRRKKKGQATNGVMALIGAIAGALGLIGGVVILIVGLSLWNSDEFSNLRDCLNSADTAAERQQCEDDFSDELTG